MNILVVVDMQNDFIDGSLGTPQAVSIVPTVVNKIKTYGDVIFMTADTHDWEYKRDTLEGKKLPVYHCVKGTPGWYLNRQIKDAIRTQQANDVYTQVIEKPTFGSFQLCEEIARYVSAHLVDEITIVGLCTDICVISNALMLRAKFPNMRIVVDAACCAGATPKSHQEALDIMEVCHIDVINS